MVESSSSDLMFAELQVPLPRTTILTYIYTAVPICLNTTQHNTKQHYDYECYFLNPLYSLYRHRRQSSHHFSFSFSPTFSSQTQTLFFFYQVLFSTPFLFLHSLLIPNCYCYCYCMHAHSLIFLSF